ncbi:hypothetical protein ACIGXM_30060 [Kitasatospora sp. NPDC052896]|uniref:hypothetical protein n=1 Tax=Kitasatospora sp. NPDC052896 TaxID=3364061 RepID=UPI0037CC82E6
MKPPEQPAAGAPSVSAESTWAEFVRSISAYTTEHAPGKVLVGPIAYATTAWWDLIAHNQAFADLFPGQVIPTNTFKWMVWEGRDQLPDHTRAWQRPVLPHLDAMLRRHPDHPELLQLARWTEQRVPQPPRQTRARLFDGAVRPLVHAQHGYGSLRIGAAAPVSGLDNRVVLMHFYGGVSPRELRQSLRGEDGTGPGAARRD